MYSLLRSIKVVQLELHRFKPSQLPVGDKVQDALVVKDLGVDGEDEGTSYLASDRVSVEVPLDDEATDDEDF